MTVENPAEAVPAAAIITFTFGLDLNGKSKTVEYSLDLNSLDPSSFIENRFTDDNKYKHEDFFGVVTHVRVPRRFVNSYPRVAKIVEILCVRKITVFDQKWMPFFN